MNLNKIVHCTNIINNTNKTIGVASILAIFMGRWCSIEIF